jgi:hypothetical protein
MPVGETIPESCPLWIRIDSTLVMAGLRSNLEHLLNQGFIECAALTRRGIQNVETRCVPRLGGLSSSKWCVRISGQNVRG